jgi:Delta24-sterol reductase
MPVAAVSRGQPQFLEVNRSFSWPTAVLKMLNFWTRFDTFGSGQGHQPLCWQNLFTICHAHAQSRNHPITSTTFWLYSLTRISRRVQWFYERKQPFRIYHGSTNSTRQPQYTRRNVIDTSPLSNIIKVDEQTKTALVEPNVPMDRLVRETIKYGLIPPVVMEFPGITVGGGFSGTSGESSSYKYGLFNNIFNWIEIVLADGKIVIASNSEEPDLFRGSAGSFGTLGVVTLLEIQLIRSKQYVELTYYPVSSVTQAIGRIEEATEDNDNQYVDGIMFGTDRGVIMSGRLTDLLRTDVKAQRFARARDPWFYLHAHRLVKNGSDPVTVAIPIVDYLFRYDRGGFWVGAYAFKYFVTPFNRGVVGAIASSLWAGL